MGRAMRAETGGKGYCLFDAAHLVESSMAKLVTDASRDRQLQR